MDPVSVRLMPRSPLLVRLLCCALVLGAAGCTNDPTSPGAGDFPTDPSLAQFSTADVDRYWRAYDAGGRLGQSDPFQRRYLDSASATLGDFARTRSVTAASLTQVVTGLPTYIEALRRWWSVTPSDPVFATVRANYARIKQQYPEAFFPPVTLVMGRFSNGGTVNRYGVVIGLEFFGVDANAPTAELNAFARANQKSWARDLPPLIAHEHVHLLSGAAGSTAGNRGNLLARALNEGVAEFIGALAAGEPTFLAMYVGWQSREREFWAAFDRERAGSDYSRWLYNQGNATPDWPGDLGYFMGYRIAQAYYNQATDKTLAIRELLALKDPEAILARSKYAGSGPTLTLSATR